MCYTHFFVVCKKIVRLSLLFFPQEILLPLQIEPHFITPCPVSFLSTFHIITQCDDTMSCILIPKLFCYAKMQYHQPNKVIHFLDKIVSFCVAAFEFKIEIIEGTHTIFYKNRPSLTNLNKWHSFLSWFTYHSPKRQNLQCSSA